MLTLFRLADIFQCIFQWDIMVRREAFMSKYGLLHFPTDPWDSFSDLDELFGKKLTSPAVCIIPVGDDEGDCHDDDDDDVSDNDDVSDDSDDDGSDADGGDDSDGDDDDSDDDDSDGGDYDDDGNDDGDDDDSGGGGYDDGNDDGDYNNNKGGNNAGNNNIMSMGGNDKDDGGYGGDNVYNDDMTILICSIHRVGSYGVTISTLVDKDSVVSTLPLYHYAKLYLKSK